MPNVPLSLIFASLRLLLRDRLIVLLLFAQLVLLPLLLWILRAWIFNRYVFAVAGIAAVAAWVRSKRALRSRLFEAAVLFGNDGGGWATGVYVALTQREIQGMLDVPSPTVCLWLETEDRNALVELLAVRIERLVLKNPWLNARLRSDRTGAPSLWYPAPSNPGADALYRGVIKPTALNVVVVPTEQELCSKRFDDSLFCDVGSKALDNPAEPLVKLSLLMSAEQQSGTPAKVALLFSFNHVAFDGGAIAAVLRTIASGEPSQTERLDPRRPTDAPAFFYLPSLDLCRKFVFFIVCASNGVVRRIVPRWLLALAGSAALTSDVGGSYAATADPDDIYFAALRPRTIPPRARLEYFLVKKEWIAEQKAQIGQFVSSNDLLLHWFCSDVSIRDAIAGAGFAINVRDVGLVSSSTSGNFMDLVVLFGSEILAGPIAIRSKVELLKRQCARASEDLVHDLPPQPAMPASPQHRRIALVSNHTKFAKTLLDPATFDLPVRVLSHFPTGKSWAAFGAVAEMMMPMLVIFQPTGPRGRESPSEPTADPDQLAVMLMTHTPILDRTPLGDPVPHTEAFCV